MHTSGSAAARNSLRAAALSSRWSAMALRGLLALLQAFLTESHKHRFGMNLHAPNVEHSLLHFVFECHYVLRLRATAVDDSQRMFARNTDWPAGISFIESGLLHQPRGRQLHLAILGRITRQSLAGDALPRQ